MNFFKASRTELKMTSNNSSTKSFNSVHKSLIRLEWDLPLLKYLVKKFDDKLVYMGLPSSSAEDILSWIEFIKTVIAS